MSTHSIGHPLPDGRSTVSLLVVLLLTLAVYAPSLTNRFAMDGRAVAKAVYDDGRPNPMVSRVRPLSDYFASHYWRGHKEASDLYRPVTVLSYALCYGLSGGSEDEAREALPQHLANVMLQVLATWLVFSMLCDFAVTRLAAVAGTLVFGVHAIHSEVVAGVVGRAELLAFCFGAGALRLFAGASGTSGRARLARQAGAAFCLFLAFCSKESAVVWIAVLPLFVHCRARILDPANAPSRKLGRAVLRTFLVAAAPLTVFAVLRDTALSDVAPDHHVLYLVNPLARLPVGQRLLSATVVLAYGLYKVVWPFSLASDYGVPFFPLIASPADPLFLAAATALLVVLVAAFRAARRNALPLLAAAVFFGFAFPTSNLPFAIGTIFGERLYYAPSFAVSLLVVWAAGALCRRPRLRASAAVFGVLWVAASAVVVVERDAVWRDNRSLFGTDARTQTSARLALNAATVAGDRDEARRLLERALALYPAYPDAAINLGGLRLRSGDLAGAEALFRRALASPDLDVARQSFEIHRNLLPILFLQGRAPEGTRELEAAIESARDGDWQELVDAGTFFVRFGRKDEARLVWEKVSRDGRAPEATRREAARRAAALR